MTTEKLALIRRLLSKVRLWIDGEDFVLLKRSSESKSVDSSVTLNCDVQEEIDYYWDKLSEGGEKARSGWLRDKFGVWWACNPNRFATPARRQVRRFTTRFGGAVENGQD